jgi:Uma2 family endonuclease
MGMPAADTRRWTYEEAYALIDGQEDWSIRYEYADGELLVTPAPGGKWHPAGASEPLPMDLPDLFRSVLDDL